LPPGGQWQALPGGDQGIDLVAVSTLLAARGVNELHVECGPRLAGSWLRAGLVDELVLYVAPRLLGEDARPLAMIGNLASLAGPPEFFIHSAGKVGTDLRIVLRPGEGGG
jgi:diaminohydroxyphosphoribosylaminopyrimidine deaminase/5-amino-6-(5-phosphoribosylamino)uracil reductase